MKILFKEIAESFIKASTHERMKYFYDLFVPIALAMSGTYLIVRFLTK